MKIIKEDRNIMCKEMYCDELEDFMEMHPELYTKEEFQKARLIESVDEFICAFSSRYDDYVNNMLRECEESDKEEAHALGMTLNEYYNYKNGNAQALVESRKRSGKDCLLENSTLAEMYFCDLSGIDKYNYTHRPRLREVNY